jgi:hypothetical protein
MILLGFIMAILGAPYFALFLILAETENYISAFIMFSISMLIEDKK